jgi:hypothetical protein
MKSNITEGRRVKKRKAWIDVVADSDYKKKRHSVGEKNKVGQIVDESRGMNRGQGNQR